MGIKKLLRSLFSFGSEGELEVGQILERALDEGLAETRATLQSLNTMQDELSRRIAERQLDEAEEQREADDRAT